MASSSSDFQLLDVENIDEAQRPQNQDKLTQIPRATYITVKELEVCCELMVDLPNLKANGFNLEEEIQIQGWEMFFDRLYGPVYDVLIKEFWLHAHPIPTRIVSCVLGKIIIVTEDRMLGLTEKVGVYKAPAGGLSPDVLSEVFADGRMSNNIKNLKNHYKVWARIINGCIHHGKESSSPDYINVDQVYIL
ncbi:unnamed protein product [Vicia faba]|uniref:Uncharacterized protein n=1 Tax=Vicia faba TaxID=3906 RepID=A0AAV0ZUA8_VICFA|nr:unnamed protein product [Vicia faba]